MLFLSLKLYKIKKPFFTHASKSCHRIQPYTLLRKFNRTLSFINQTYHRQQHNPTADGGENEIIPAEFEIALEFLTFVDSSSNPHNNNRRNMRFIQDNLVPPNPRLHANSRDRPMSPLPTRAPTQRNRINHTAQNQIGPTVAPIMEEIVGAANRNTTHNGSPARPGVSYPTVLSPNTPQSIRRMTTVQAVNTFGSLSERMASNLSQMFQDVARTPPHHNGTNTASINNTASHTPQGNAHTQNQPLPPQNFLTNISFNDIGTVYNLASTAHSSGHHQIHQNLETLILTMTESMTNTIARAEAVMANATRSTQINNNNSTNNGSNLGGSTLARDNDHSTNTNGNSNNNN